MLMVGADSIREVIAFPKTKTADCPLTNAPAPVDNKQLRELGVRLVEKLADQLKTQNQSYSQNQTQTPTEQMTALKD